MHGEPKITWADKVRMFYMHYHERLDQPTIAQRKGISQQYVSRCVSEVWKFLMKEGVLTGSAPRSVS
jgi:DNA-binding transcriptional regulator LsrR (DeoR family)